MKSSAILFAVLAAASPAAAEVVVKSATDASACTPAERTQNTITLRHTLDRLASRLSTASAHVDATIVSFTVEPRASVVVVSARVRLAISDENGRIVSVLTGGANVETPRGARTPKVGRRRDDAVTAAVEGMFGNVKIAVASATPGPRRVGNLVVASRPRS